VLDITEQMMRELQMDAFFEITQFPIDKSDFSAPFPAKSHSRASRPCLEIRVENFLFDRFTHTRFSSKYVQVAPASPGEPSMGKPRVNLVFIGHVDYGKSTLVGRMLFEKGLISEAVIKKFEEMGDKGKTFKFAWVMMSVSWGRSFKKDEWGAPWS